ncbi:MAG TPA: Ig-like domain-containing protein [Thermohalobaculum sp.]|nr:Ig-like domain-containing protein [Thermohalobaculum sp.]
MPLRLRGSSGNDVLSGIGGSYQLSGGKGDDTYIVDDAGDTVDEKNNSGTDSVRSYITYVLGANVEHLILEGGADIDGTGNELDNQITGNSGDNTLVGLDGSDTLDGGAGDDSLFGGASDDLLIGGTGSDLQDGGDGTDTALFAGLSTDYSIELVGAEIWVTRTAGGVTERDVLRNIEFLAFDDRTIAADTVSANLAPVAVADGYAATAGTTFSSSGSVLDNDSDPDNDPLSVTGFDLTSAGGGSVQMNADGSFTYVAADGFSGTDSFSYTIGDGRGGEDSALVTIEVAPAPANSAPIALGDSYSAVAGTGLSNAGSVLANDSDPDGDALSVVAFDEITAGGGTVSMSADGMFNYTPAAGFTGTDSFTYSAGDGNGATASAAVEITVEAAGAVPYYVEGLLLQEWMRLNFPDALGTGTTVTYAFPDAVPGYYSAGHWVNSGFTAFTAEQQQATRDALATIASMTNLTFVEVPLAEAEITLAFADVQGSSPGLAYMPSWYDGIGSIESDVWIDIDFAADSFAVGSEAYELLLHEIAHALGLTHPDFPTAEETRQYTVMATATHATMTGSVSTYQLFDIATLQYLYGANTAYASGDDIYDFAYLGGRMMTLWDGGGHDALDLSAATYGVDIDLGAGAFSTIAASGSNNLAIAYGTVIEDVTGSQYNDSLTGNAAGNRLDGGKGDDVLTGNAGPDVFAFGSKWGDDIVTDFTRGEDRLDFSAAGIGFEQLTISVSGADTILFYKGDTVLLAGVTDLDQSDFI